MGRERALRGPAFFRLIADIGQRRDVVFVVSLYRPMTQRWVPPFSVAGIFHRQELEHAVSRFRNIPLQWRWASPGDWPPQRLMSRDFRFARRGAYWFVVEVDQVRLFLVPRGWDEPEWGMAAYDREKKQWRDLGDLEPAAEQWDFPEPKEPRAAA